MKIVRDVQGQSYELVGKLCDKCGYAANQGGSPADVIAARHFITVDLDDGPHGNLWRADLCRVCASEILQAMPSGGLFMRAVARLEAERGFRVFDFKVRDESGSTIRIESIIPEPDLM
ncbi:hypothetical protein D0B54_21270 [Solimonas sp. K1W22B-7]|uniref:hypothetical protein n=1 Tax=Solimonas sp. K1W22B-7 TaxID=2303331 RepID=UPI000E32E7A8|nr:hypothetical protein [Solimonas sp. K1W22B-7]AXQ31053.1 hypothetical protein D0B54_21270 [Solimonas sp. K1W22B-7]